MESLEQRAAGGDPAAGKPCLGGSFYVCIAVRLAGAAGSLGEPARRAGRMGHHLGRVLLQVPS